MQDKLIGSMLGQYRIDELVGRGGMATVYKAYQPSLDRFVALKVLPGHSAADPAFLERFRREARAIARLEHPNILPIYDFGEHEDIPFIVMPFVARGTLKERMGLPLPVHWAAHMCEQLARALDYAHAQAIVHRDVKPSNALVGHDDTLLLADFGLAKMVGAQEGLTRTGVGIGTPEYISPEQAQGRPVDARTDLYALAMIFFEMVAGRVAYESESPVGMILMHIQEPVPSLRAAKLAIPTEVDAVVQRALAKAPEDRYGSPGEFIDALNEAIRVSLPSPDRAKSQPPVLAGRAAPEILAAHPRQLELRYAELVRAMDAGEWETALAICKRVLFVSPTYLDVTIRLARCEQEVRRLGSVGGRAVDPARAGQAGPKRVDGPLAPDQTMEAPTDRSLPARSGSPALRTRLIAAAAGLVVLIGTIVGLRTLLAGSGPSVATDGSDATRASDTAQIALAELPDRGARALAGTADRAPGAAAGGVGAARAAMLEDNFEKAATGLLAEASDRPSVYRVGYVDGEYAVTSIDPALTILMGPLPGSFTDTTLTIDARALDSGSGPNGHVVLACRGQPTTSPSEYRFYVDPTDGTFSLERRDNDVAVSLSPWQKSTAILLGTATNHLDLICSGSTISGRINDVEVASVTDTAYRQGALLIGAGSFAGTFDARFDNLVVAQR